MDIIADMIFKYPNLVAVHNSSLEETYGYSFDEPSHVDNALSGYAYHSVELFYLFLNAHETMDESRKALAENFAASFIDFAYGKKPWSPFGGDKQWMVFGPECKSELKNEVELKNEPFWNRAQVIKKSQC